MGIQGLLPVVKTVITPAHVRSYEGKKAAVDTYSWLHKASYTCSKDICEGRLADRLVEYCMHRVNLLRHFGVKPLLVFDGGVLPMKAEQESKRGRSRIENLERAREHERQGNHAAAYECYQKAVDITPALAAKFTKVLRRESVEFIVAPYEADAQMAYLARNGLVDVVITEDSDLIAYGCPRVLFKMDKMGQGDEFLYSELVRNKDLNFANFTQQMVLEMCIMTGCDYLSSLPGMGVKKAHSLMRRFKCYKKVIRYLRFSGATIPAEYEERFQRAILTFHHQRVYDPDRRRIVHLTDVPDDLSLELDFVGPALSEDLVRAIAEGEVDPCTLLPFENPDETVVAQVEQAPPRRIMKMITQTTRRRYEMPAQKIQKNVLTNYYINRGMEKQFKAPRPVSDSQQQQQVEMKDRLSEGSPYMLTDSSQDLSMVFGSPLPEDGDEDLDSATGGDVDNIDSLWDAQDTFDTNDRASPAGGARRLPAMETKTNLVYDAPWPRASKYFQAPRLEGDGRGRPSSDNFLACHTDPQLSPDSDRVENAKKTKFAFHEAASKVVDEEPSQSSSVARLYTQQGSPETHRASQVFEKDGRPELGKFAADVSHVSDFARIAKNSFDEYSQRITKIDKFSQSIAPYRCSTGKGARASGLRAPMRNISDNASKGSVGRGQSTLEDFQQFSHQPTKFRPPFQKLPFSHSSLGTSYFVRDQSTESSFDWPMTGEI